MPSVADIRIGSFFGVRTDVPDLLLQADCFLLPSHAEGLGISAVEAQASGLSCILSANVPREVELCDHVFFLEIGDGAAGQWAEQILAVSRQKIERRGTLPKNCGYLIEQEAEKLAEQYKKPVASAGK